MMNLQGRTNKSAAPTTMWQSEINSPNVVLSLACCPMNVEMGSTICSKKNASVSTPASHDLDQQNQSAVYEAREQTMNEAMKGEQSTEHKQDGDVGSAMTEKFNFSHIGVSDNGRQLKREAVPFKEWALKKSMKKNHRDMERMETGLRLVCGSGREFDGCENLIKYLRSMEQPGKLPSSQYKGVVPQPNGRWGAQIYEKHQRVWLGTFNREEDAARAYDLAAVKFRGRETMINFCPVGDGDLEARFMREHNKEEIINMIRKHTYDEEFECHRKRFVITAARSAPMTKAEASGSEGSGQGANVQETLAAVDGQGNAATSAIAMAGLSREHLFEKAVTPSDVGKLNRLVIPKLHAEKYFAVDVNSREKGLLLNFEDNTEKVWQFRYSYWKSSQSYVLTKGWSRFVKDKKLEAGDIVSFHRGSAQPRQLYISWKRMPLRHLGFGVDPDSRHSRGKLMYRGNILSSLNAFNFGAPGSVIYDAPWMPIFWSSSSNPDPFTLSKSNSVSPLVRRVDDHVYAQRSQSPATDLNGTFPFYLSQPPPKQTDERRVYDINSDGLPSLDLHLDLHSSPNSGNEATNIKSLHPSVNRAGLSAAEERETPEHIAASTVDPATEKVVRLFGVTLAEARRSA